MENQGQQQQQTTNAGQPAVIDPLTGAAEGTRPKSDIEAREMAKRAVAEAEAKEAGAGAEGSPPAEPPKPAEPGPPAVDPKYERMATGYAELEAKVRKLEKETLPDLQKKAQAHDALMARLADPDQRYKAAEDLGLDYREWTDRVVDDPEAAKTPEQKRVEALEKKIDELLQARETEQTEAQKTKAQAELQARQQYAADLVEKGGDSYAFTKALKQSDALLFKHQQMTKAGTPPESDEAVAAAVEADLTERLKEDLTALSGIPRFRELIAELGYVYQAKPGGNEPARQDPKSAKQSGLAHGASTLTNDDSAEPGSGFDYTKATPQEKREHAARKAKEAVERQREVKGIA
jgi:hypothetical protein